jgi:hypothetical protein
MGRQSCSGTRLQAYRVRGGHWSPKEVKAVGGRPEHGTGLMPGMRMGVDRKHCFGCFHRGDRCRLATAKKLP